jgi:hypothetical protein
MKDKIALSDQFEERLIEFAARIIRLAGRLPKNAQGRHIASQICDQVLLALLTMLKRAQRKVGRISFTRCGLC